MNREEQTPLLDYQTPQPAQRRSLGWLRFVFWVAFVLGVSVVTARLGISPDGGPLWCGSVFGAIALACIAEWFRSWLRRRRGLDQEELVHQRINVASLALLLILIVVTVTVLFL